MTDAEARKATKALMEEAFHDASLFSVQASNLGAIAVALFHARWAARLADQANPSPSGDTPPQKVLAPAPSAPTNLRRANMAKQVLASSPYAQGVASRDTSGPVVDFLTDLRHMVALLHPHTSWDVLDSLAAAHFKTESMRKD